jgi:hypothetical protein
LPDKTPGSLSEDPSEVSSSGRPAAFIYIGASLVAALFFWLVTTFTPPLPATVEPRVFVLMVIVLMPIVIPREKLATTEGNI